MVISRRSRSKSIPGMIRPLDVLAGWREGEACGPFRSLVSLEAGTGTVRFASVKALPTGRCVAEAAGVFQRLQDLAQTFILHGQRAAEFRSGEHGAFGKQREHLFREILPRFVAEFRYDLQVDRLGVGGDQFQRDRRRGRHSWSR